jgi:hypothetical protein
MDLPLSAGVCRQGLPAKGPRLALENPGNPFLGEPPYIGIDYAFFIKKSGLDHRPGP